MQLTKGEEDVKGRFRRLKLEAQEGGELAQLSTSGDGRGDGFEGCVGRLWSWRRSACGVVSMTDDGDQDRRSCDAREVEEEDGRMGEESG